MALTVEDFRGRCHGCGFLAKRAVGPRQLPEVWFEMREEDRMWGMAFTHVPDTWIGQISTMPVCYRLQRPEIWPLEAGAELPGDGDHNREIATAQFTRDRKCGAWMAYQHGMSPRDHLVEWKTLELERMRREHEDRLAEITTTVLIEQATAAAEHAKTAEAHLKIAEAHKATAENLVIVSEKVHRLQEEGGQSSLRYNRRFLFLAGLSAVLSVLALGQLVFPNGVPGIRWDDNSGTIVVLTPTPLPTPAGIQSGTPAR